MHRLRGLFAVAALGFAAGYAPLRDFLSHKIARYLGLGRRCHAYLVALTVFFVPIQKEILFLWPWWFGIGAYKMFLASPQGESLAQSFVQEPASRVVVFVALIAVGLTLAACVLIAQAAAYAHPGATNNRRNRPPYEPILQVGTAGFSVVGTSCSYGALFVQATGSSIGLLAMVVFASLTCVAWFWLTITAGVRETKGRNAVLFLQRHRLVLTIAAAVLALLPLATGAVIGILAPNLFTGLGPLLIAMVGLGALTNLFGIVLVVIPTLLRLPWLGLGILLIASSWTLSRPIDADGANPLLKEAVQDAEKNNRHDASCATTPSSLDESLTAHIKNGSPFFLGNYENEFATGIDRSIYLVSAEGGGIRAAYWTALNLARLDVATGYRFGDEVTSLSGVSGSSLGIATWMAVRERQDLSGHDRVELVSRFLRSDFLSPMLGGLFFLDAPRMLLGPLWFKSHRDHVFEKALEARWREIGKTDFFARPFFRLCLKGLRLAPAVYFNATDARTGSYVPLTTAPLPRPPSTEGLPIDLSKTNLGNASVAQIVNISASFPYLAPAAEVGIQGAALAMKPASRLKGTAATEKQPITIEGTTEQKLKPAENPVARAFLLVDGGYYDNMGLTPTKDAVALVQLGRYREKLRGSYQGPFQNTNVKVVHISNNPGQLCLPLVANPRPSLSDKASQFLSVSKQRLRCQKDVDALEESLRPGGWSNWLLGPLQTLLSVRGQYEVLNKGNISSLEGSEIGTDIFNYVDLSLSRQLEDVASSREAPTNRAFATFRVESAAALSTSMLEKTLADGKISRIEAEEYLDEITAWSKERIGQLDQSECFRRLPKRLPPLGWALTRTDGEILTCLSILTSINQDPYLLIPLPRRRHPQP